MNKAIIFDMDGVIITGDTARFKFLKQSYEKVGLSLDDNLFPKIIGVTFKNFLTETNTDSAKKAVLLDMFQKGYLNKITKYVSPISTTVNFIKNYRGPKKLAVASNGFQKINEIIAKKIGIYRYLSAMVSHEAVINPKPDPAIYLKTAKILGVNPKNCVAIEDSVIGARAAIEASMSCFIFINSCNNKNDFSGMKISGFVEKPEDFNKISTL